LQVGAVFPQTEIGADVAGIRDWATSVEALGFAEIEAFDHVLGAHRTHWEEAPPRGFTRAPYTADDAFFEPFVLFAYLAGITTRVGFATSVLVLPQRQTALVAKQAATLDVLSGGRLRLGIGAGWNHVEYDALGMEFRGRGPRIDEQVAVLRRLFAEPVVTFDGKWHEIDRAGINPRPAGAVEIWIGGTSDAAIKRVARSSDGWVMGRVVRPDNAVEHVGRLEAALEDAGRTRADVALGAWLPLHGRGPSEWREELGFWRELGVERLGVLTRGAGTGPVPHLALLEEFASL
jgi:probable F420-dependent oxidoreductase